MIDQRKADRVVAIWLFVCCALVFAMVVLGGVTRLTGSGLSMVDWRPIMGVLPPLNDAQWQQTFEMYQNSPEFQKVNSDFDVEAFKGIFWLEYLHRLLGRIIGLAFLLPFLFLLYRGYIKRHEWLKYTAMFVLGGLQGVLGWYMVKSGLVDNPHVSQYRLVAHLLAAVGIYAFMLWVALGLWRDADSARRHPWFSKMLALTVLIVITLTSGGFVAGLKAGHIYNTFPLMGDSWIPQGLGALDPGWRNLFDNMVTVQFTHRILALSTFALLGLAWVFALRGGLPARLRLAVHCLMAAAVIQVVLGISTLLLKVPVALASAHQAGALLLFTVALYLTHALSGGVRARP